VVALLRSCCRCPRPRSLGDSNGYRRRNAQCRWQRRCSSPARRCAGHPPRSSSIAASGSRPISIRRAGVSICSFMRSMRLVPPAMSLAAGFGGGGASRRDVAGPVRSGTPSCAASLGHVAELPRRCWHRRRSGRYCRSSVRQFSASVQKRAQLQHRPLHGSANPPGAQPTAQLRSKSGPACSSRIAIHRGVQMQTASDEDRPPPPAPRWW